MMIGDRVSAQSRLTVGGDAIRQIRQFQADLCILGINAIDAKVGITDNDWEVVQIKRAMIESARKVVCVTIREKMNTVQPIQICGPECIDVLVTEEDPDNPCFNAYKSAGIRIL